MRQVLSITLLTIVLAVSVVLFYAGVMRQRRVEDARHSITLRERDASWAAMILGERGSGLPMAHEDVKRVMGVLEAISAKRQVQLSMSMTSVDEIEITGGAKVVEEKYDQLVGFLSDVGALPYRITAKRFCMGFQCSGNNFDYLISVEAR